MPLYAVDGREGEWVGAGSTTVELTNIRVLEPMAGATDSRRAQLRASYIDGWNRMDSGLLLSAVSEDFLFDDPTDPAPVDKAGLVAYMPQWPAKARALGAAFDFEVTDKSVLDRGGILLEWYWWRLVGTDVEGSAVIRTSDRGVESERLTYFRCPWPLLR